MPTTSCCPAPLLAPSFPGAQGTEYTSVCLDAERGTRMLLSASMDRGGSEWVTAHSLEVDTLLVGGRAGAWVRACVRG